MPTIKTKKAGTLKTYKDPPARHALHGAATTDTDLLAFIQDEVTMTVILFGAPGMVGQGVLRECLLAHVPE
ncbi:MAG TPA: hypothetical protein VIJ04_13545 [Xanthobacteraceae bacterium]